MAINKGIFKDYSDDIALIEGAYYDWISICGDMMTEYAPTPTFSDLVENTTFQLPLEYILDEEQQE